MDITIKNIEFTPGEEVFKVKSPSSKIMSISNIDQIAVIRFKLTKESIQMDGIIEMSKDDYLTYARNLENRIKELLLN